MTTKSMLVQVRMPPRLVEALDHLAKEGLYTSRSEAILDAVRRLALAYERENPLRQSIIRKYLGRPGKGSIENLVEVLNAEEITQSLERAFPGKSIDEIISEVRR